MFTPKVIAAFVAAMFVLLVSFDVYLAIDGTSDNTFSEVIRDWGRKRWWVLAILPGGLGLLAGHWFLSRRKVKPTKKQAAVVFGSLLLGTVAGWWLW